MDEANSMSVESMDKWMEVRVCAKYPTMILATSSTASEATIADNNLRSAVGGTRSSLRENAERGSVDCLSCVIKDT